MSITYRHGLAAGVVAPILLLQPGCTDPGDTAGQDPIEEATLSADVVFLEDEASGCLDDAIEFADADMVLDLSCEPDDIGLKIGSLLSGRQGGGYRVIVTGIAKDDDGRWRVAVEPAALADFFDSSFSFKGWAEVQSTNAPPAGGAGATDISFGPLVWSDLTLVDDGTIAVGIDTLTVGSDLALYLDFEVDKDDGVQDFYVDLDLGFYASMELYARAVASQEHSAEQALSYGGSSFVQVGTAMMCVSAVCVDFDVVVEIYVGSALYSSAGVEVTAGASTSVDVIPYLSYAAGSGWDSGVDIDATTQYWGPNWDAWGTVDPVEVWVRPVVSLQGSPYGADWLAEAGASLGLRTYAGARADVTATTYDWELYTGQDVSLGFELDWLSRAVIEEEVGLGGWEKTIAQGGGAFTTAEVCDNEQDDDGDGLSDCLDSDCTTESACAVVIDTFTGFAAIQGTTQRVTFYGHNFVGDPAGAAPRLYAGDGVSFADAEVLSDEVMQGEMTVSCAAPSGTVTVEYAQPGEPSETDCDSAGRACTSMNVVADPTCGVPDCGNLLDDDGDGWVDLDDPGCGGDTAGEDEGGLDTSYECNDGVDNDGNGDIDADDAGCTSGTEVEAPTTEADCTDSADNDGDGHLDCDDADCAADTSCASWPWGEVSLWGADAHYTGAGGGDRAGDRVSGLPDVDGDGLDDLLIGAYGANTAYVVLGATTPTSLSLSSADYVLEGVDSGDQAGAAVAGLGDVDGDGRGDLLVGATGGGAYGYGAAYLVLGSSLSASHPLDGADGRYDGSYGEGAGTSVAAAGDFNGDGLQDMLIGAYAYDDLATDGGAVFVVLGDSDPSAIAMSTPSIRLTGESDSDRAGWALSGVGDVDGDGIEDILIGAYISDLGGSDAGAAYLILGDFSPVSGSLSGADARFDGEAADEWAGYAVGGAGDANGDGYRDLIIGAPRHDDSEIAAGAAYLILGQAVPADGLLTAADARFTGQDQNDYVGYSVSGGGDINGDGFDDLIIGAPNAGSGTSYQGEAFVFLGSSAPTGTSSAASDAALAGESNGDYVGWWVSFVGNVDGDGYDDMLIGAPGDDDGGSTSGSAYLILGGP